MICTSIGHVGYREALSILEGCEMAELRLDLCDFTDDELRSLCSVPVPLIATFRHGKAALHTVQSVLCRAIDFGVLYVDIEIDMPEETACKIVSYARSKGCGVIRSWHDFSSVPPVEELHEIVGRCRRDSDLVKIVGTATDKASCERILSLYSYAGNLIAFAMGDAGAYTRVEALRLGAPFTYASAPGSCTAPGQMDAAEMYRQCYGMDRPFRYGVSEICVPASKSAFQRLAVAAALSGRTVELQEGDACDDSRHAQEFAEFLTNRQHKRL